jgi:hypothetical protein
VARKLVAGNPPIFTQVWLSTMEEATAQPLGAIWVRPKEYDRSSKLTNHSLFETFLTR